MIFLCRAEFCLPSGTTESNGFSMLITRKPFTFCITNRIWRRSGASLAQASMALSQRLANRAVISRSFKNPKKYHLLLSPLRFALCAISSFWLSMMLRMRLLHRNPQNKSFISCSMSEPYAVADSLLMCSNSASTEKCFLNHEWPFWIADIFPPDSGNALVEFHFVFERGTARICIDRQWKFVQSYRWCKRLQLETQIKLAEWQYHHWCRRLCS